MRDIRRLIAATTIWHGSQIRRIGLDQHALQRHFFCNVAQISRRLEAHNARKRNVETHVDARAGDIPGFREAMHHAADFFCPFLAHDAQRVLGSATRVNHQRFAAFTCGADVGTKALALPFKITC